MFGLFFCHRLMAGNRELFGMDLLCDGQRKSVPFAIALLLVWWNGIMDLRFDAVVCKILLEFVATRAENGENMIDGISRTTSRNLVVNEP